MIPAHFVSLEHLPLTTNGKVNRNALPSPQGHGEEAMYVAPRNRIEQQIAEVWRQALKVDRVGINDNFFDLGGHSLLMAQVHSQLNQQFQREIPLIKLLEYPTIRAMAQFMTDGQDEQAIVAQGQGRAQQQRQARRRRRRIRQDIDVGSKDTNE
jgi:acyl carrier protein